MTEAVPLPPAATVIEDVARALEEDIGSGDCTAALVPPAAQLQTAVLCREEAVLCGRAWFDRTFRQLSREISIHWDATDGETVPAGRQVCRLRGPARELLSGERTALNFLQTLSGTASRARAYVQAVQGTGAVILDTRKTLPGLRLAQKYAVRCGGASNHRTGLFDAVLVKENHIAAAGSISAAVEKAARLYPDLLLEVEVEAPGQIEEACRAGAQRVLLDNFSREDLASAVAHYHGRIGLEASGGVDLQSVRDIALTGVDFISVGDITKNVQAIDFSMRYI